jgi:hypothetical protein
LLPPMPGMSTPAGAGPVQGDGPHIHRLLPSRLRNPGPLPDPPQFNTALRTRIWPSAGTIFSWGTITALTRMTSTARRRSSDGPHWCARAVRRPFGVWPSALHVGRGGEWTNRLRHTETSVDAALHFAANGTLSTLRIVYNGNQPGCPVPAMSPYKVEMSIMS